MRQIIEIENFNPKWESEFCKLRAVIENAMRQLILSIEHVGSTSVKGLGAKPILDIDVVIQDYNVLPNVIKDLEKIGYFHQENWSFEGREAPLEERIYLFHGMGKIQYGWNIMYTYVTKTVKN